MALFKSTIYVKASADAAFDKIHKPGDPTPHSGIYRCEGCGKEVTSNSGNPLPPQNHHQHTSGQGDIRWRMIVFSQTGG
jgi:hypothetical protein